MFPGKKLASRKAKIRPITPFLIVAVCLLAAVGFSISVESRSSGWLRKDQQIQLRRVQTIQPVRARLC
jgi:hypothetical protein